MFESFINQTGISLERLVTLCEIAESGTISAATAGNANRQSQFSRQVAEMETFFGCELLDRRARPYRLSEAGRELAQVARVSLDGLNDFLARRKGLCSRLLVGAGESLIQWLLLPKLMSGVRYKGTLFVFKNLDTASIVEGIQSGQLDVGLVRQSAIPDGNRVGGDFEYRYKLFVPRRLLSKRRGSRAFMLSDLPLALMEGGGELRCVIESMARAAGVSLCVTLECSSYPQIATVIASGQCAGVLPEFAAQFLPPSVVVHDFGIAFEPLVTRKVSLIWTARTEAMKPWVHEAASLLMPK